MAHILHFLRWLACIGERLNGQDKLMQVSGNMRYIRSLFCKNQEEFIYHLLHF